MFQTCGCGTAVQRFGADRDAFLQGFGAAGNDQCCCRVQQCDVAKRARLAGEHASPPTRPRPASSGVTSKVRIWPFSSAATDVGPVSVISSRPSEPCTTQTASAPRFFNTCASGCTHCLENTPTICRLTPAGLDSGPSRLKMVRVASSVRVGPTFFLAGGGAGANMKPMPASCTQRPTCSGLRSIFTPRDDNTSAAPERDDSARLPCLATGTPQPATMKEAQVETLNEPEPSH